MSFSYNHGCEEIDDKKIHFFAIRFDGYGDARESKMVHIT